jgi:putative salt-induced outer membrane protein YdiY
MIRTLLPASWLVSGLVGGLTTLLPAQTQFAAPLPSVDAGLVEASLPVLQPAESKGNWKSSLNLGATYATGNTTLRTANMAADATRKSGRHETILNAAWNYAEQKDNTTLRWGLDQRRTSGGAKHKYYFSDEERTYGFVAIDAENNLNQAIDLRLTATLGVGRQLIKEEDLKFSVELGAGDFVEQSRTVGVKDAEFITGRAGTDLAWDMNEDWQLLHALKFFFSLEDGDEMYGESDARLRASMGEGMFAQAQWILQWDNTPSRKANGTRNDSIDHLFLLSIGWAF